MTPDGAFDRRLTTWLEENAAPRAPQGFDDLVAESVDQWRQLPSWATPERWISMETRAQLGAMPRAATLILTLAILVAALAAGLALAGNLTRADDGDDVTAGLTYFTPDGVIYKHTTDGPVRLTDDDEYAVGPAWSPDGRHFAYRSATDPSSPNTIVIRDADGSNPVVVTEPIETEPPGVPPNFHFWSPDGSRVVYSADGLDDVAEVLPCGLGGTFCGQRIWSVPSDGSEPARVIGGPDLDARSPLWTPDGEHIIFTGSSAGSGADYGIYRMDADGANVERISDLTGKENDLYFPAISPDGTTLAVEMGDIYLVDLDSGEDMLIAGEEADEFEPRWSPDGSLVAFTSWAMSETAEPQAMLYDVASGEMTPLDLSLIVLGWSPDGRSILGHWPDGVLTVADVTDPSAPVATQVEGIDVAFGASWQPRPE